MNPFKSDAVVVLATACEFDQFQMEEKLDREKRMRLDLEKAKRKMEGELRVMQESMEEINKQKHDIEQILKR